MNEIPGLTDERAHALALLGTELTAKLVSKLTGLGEEAATRLLLEAGFKEKWCSASDLAQLCCTRAIALPPGFLRGLDARQASNAASESWARELIALLRQQGLAHAVVDYAAFRRLTTFDAADEYPHTGERGLYAYRYNADGEKAGIVTGPSMRELVEGELGTIGAEHQRDARLDLPTTAEALVLWLSKQGGDVHLNDTDHLAWIQAIAAIAAPVVESRAGLDPADPGSMDARARPGAKANGRVGGETSNRENRRVRAAIVDAYKQGVLKGAYPSKNLAAIVLAKEFSKAVGSVRNLLKGL